MVNAINERKVGTLYQMASTSHSALKVASDAKSAVLLEFGFAHSHTGLYLSLFIVEVV